MISSAFARHCAGCAPVSLSGEDWIFVGIELAVAAMLVWIIHRMRGGE